jgi:transposase
MKDGRTHLAHKAEHAVDLETGAIVAVTLQPADRGDTQSVEETLDESMGVLEDVLEHEAAEQQMDAQLFEELVADKGYHSNEVLRRRQALGVRTYISEPKRGRRNWQGKGEEQQAVYANRRRVRGKRGRALLRLRGERIERTFAHCYETGGMRRTHLRGHENIQKRLLIHVAGFNLGLLMRKLTGIGKPRVLQGALRLLLCLVAALRALGRRGESCLRRLLSLRNPWMASEAAYAKA